MTLNTLRTKINALATYNIQSCLSHFTVSILARLVGVFVIRTWKITETIINTAKKSTWMARPAIMMFSPILTSSWLFALASRPPPADCARNESTSPKTKIFVSHFARMGEQISPSVNRIMRPRTI